MIQPTTAGRASAQVLSVHPIELDVPGRPVPLALRVSAPIGGAAWPVVLLSHGHGPSHFLSSLHGYAPLAEGLAARGFVVVQPTHLDAKSLPFRASDHPDAPLFWRSRAADMSHVLDRIDEVERAVPGLAGRIDHARVAVVGHSMGGHTASVLLGARHVDPGGGATRIADPRIRAGVLLAAPGRGEALSAFARENYGFLATIDVSTMTAPALVVAGDRDDHPFMKTTGAAWHEDPFHGAPAPKALLTLVGGEHGLGGVAGYDAAETTDPSPERVAILLDVVAAYLRGVLVPGDTSWDEARAALAGSPLARITTK